MSQTIGSRWTHKIVPDCGISRALAHAKLYKGGRTIKYIVYTGLCLSFIGLPGAVSADLLAGKNGMTLYTFDPDTGGKSVCSWYCVRIWPPAEPGDAQGPEFGAITREGGARQLTYEGKPLYYYMGDHRPGDANGAGIDRGWHVVTTGTSHHASK